MAANSVTVCTVTKVSNEAFFTGFINKHVAPLCKGVVHGRNVADFEAVKNSNDDLILAVEGNTVHDVLKYLCDDYASEKRRVKMIYSFSAGVDSYHLNLLQDELKGIPFANAQGCFSSVLGEHVIYSMLYFNRHTARIQKNRSEHKWDVFDMIELRGQTMGIIGYGDIGRACARLARAFGMNVLGVKRTAPAAPVDELGVHVLHGDEGTERALRESDFDRQRLPGVKSMLGFFNKDTFAKMKPTAVYINIGRGVTQVEADIYDAVNTGVIAGAAVDVFEKEPLPEDSPLWKLGDDKVLLTAHNGDLTKDLYTVTATRFGSLVEEYLKTGKIDTYTVNPATGY